MVSLSFNIQPVVLVIALLVLQEQHSSAHALFGKLRKKEWLKFNSMQKDHDSVDGIIASVGGIRKMLVKQEHMVDSEILKKNAQNSLGVINFSEQNLERSKKEESKKFADAEDEVAKLMNKDYTGRNVPRRKPPINNHKPTD
ncbi:hypothetical protein CQW23_05493 [Capsicum baccatum]|uniref:Uncharacterized protein n=1 Tax=Capsicum baccatum TaxID=33114 RepID=A0A2G2XHQ8_CAPBA|nr:hypothetical protein CQW23_05493 [Capsicum baccatum]